MDVTRFFEEQEMHDYDPKVPVTSYPTESILYRIVDHGIGVLLVALMVGICILAVFQILTAQGDCGLIR